MPLDQSAQVEPLTSFEKGMDQESSPTMMPKGVYEYAQNMIMGVDGARKYLASCKVDASLDAGVTWGAADPIWFAPYTMQTISGGIVTESTHLLVATLAAGQVYRYDTGSPGTITNVRRGFNGTYGTLVTQAIYDRYLITMNGINAPMKYAQHFYYENSGNLTATPYMFPLGSKPISPIDSGVTGETTTHGGAGAYVTDTAASLGTTDGARVGSGYLRVAVSQNTTIEWAVARNLLTGPQPYGGTDFAGTDSIVFQYKKGATAAGFTVDFAQDNTFAAFFRFTIAAGDITGDGVWRTLTKLRSTATVGAGAPVWSNIKIMRITNSDAANALDVDDFYFLYAVAPPAFQVGCSHKDRVIGGGVPLALNLTRLSNMYWSRAQFPDEFPTANTQVLASGAGLTLARTNQINVLREFGDVIIVGLSSTILSWTLDAAGNPTRSIITSEFGMDAQRGIAETPAGSLLFPWQRGFYTIRSTGRQLISGKIIDVIGSLDLVEPWWTIAVIDEQTKTIRFWFRETNGVRVSRGVIFDYSRAQEEGEPIWVGEMTQLADYATAAYVDGVRRTLTCRNNVAGINVLHQATSGTLAYEIRLPWMARGMRDFIAKWQGVTLQYSATAAVTVQVRYATNPHEFAGASWETVATLPANPTIAEQARVPFGRASRWAQMRLTTSSYGMRLYPPVIPYGHETQRPP